MSSLTTPDALGDLCCSGNDSGGAAPKPTTRKTWRGAMDEPYIEYCGQQFSWYGHMHAVILHPNRLSVQMDAEAAMQMDDDGQIDVRFNLSPERYAQLQQALRATFYGCDYYREER